MTRTGVLPTAGHPVEAGDPVEAVGGASDAPGRFAQAVVPRWDAAQLAFMAIMGHELRTPVSSIVTGAELLHGDRLDVATRDEVTRLVVEEAHRVNMLIEQLTALTLLRTDPNPAAAEPVHVVHVVREVGAREARRRPGMRLGLPSLEPRHAIALADENFVKQVLVILIDNAAKYAAAAGDIEIAVDREGDEVVVRVLDRGPGLRGVRPGVLFELFERAPAYEGDRCGSGIGLFVAGQIVAAMDGRIWGTDRPGGGAEFGFAPPAAD